jgi:hypothetical protein
MSVRQPGVTSAVLFGGVPSLPSHSGLIHLGHQRLAYLRAERSSRRDGARDLRAWWYRRHGEHTADRLDAEGIPPCRPIASHRRRSVEAGLTGGSLDPLALTVKLALRRFDLVGYVALSSGTPLGDRPGLIGLDAVVLEIRARDDGRKPLLLQQRAIGQLSLFASIVSSSPMSSNPTNSSSVNCTPKSVSTLNMKFTCASESHPETSEARVVSLRTSESSSNTARAIR